MAVSGLPVLSMLRMRMQWHQERQRLLAENVANADTPSFQPRDLAPLEATAGSAGGSLKLARTDAAHKISAGGEATSFAIDRRGRFDVRASGNSVSLEDEMMKVAANQMDFQAASTLYTRSLGLIKTALGRR